MTSTDLVPNGAARRNATRQKILAAARELFVTQGYHATRPQDITRVAGVGHGTFYLHFADKQACFLAFVEGAASELDEVIAAEVTGVTGIEATIRAVLRGIHVFSLHNPGVLNAALTDLTVIAAGHAPAEKVAERWAGQWAEWLRHAADAGEIADDCDLLLIGHAMVGAIIQTGSFAYRKSGGREVQTLALWEDLARFLTRGLERNRSSTSATRDRTNTKGRI